MQTFDKRVNEAMDETRRFLKKGDEYLAKAAVDRYASGGCAESGAVRRASMDLTRALAALRRR